MQHAHAQGHDVDLVPAVLVGAVISSLVTLPLAWPFQAIGARRRPAGLAGPGPAGDSLRAVGDRARAC